MLYLFIKSYANELLAIFGFSTLFLIFGLYLIFRPRKGEVVSIQHEQPIIDSGYHADADDTYSEIAGDDVLTTQLDLARAYIESGQAPAASSLLKTVLAKGNELQQQEARQLLTRVG